MKLKTKLLRAGVLVFSLLLAAFGMWFSQKRASNEPALMPSSKLKIFRSHALTPPAGP
ncbi:hypothetical protein [Prosthecobacter sp.]|jgi:hypothetical protein|uniref:hypothetical protein n=1 Tax=Prosthecobacter sp. TaxID=1965333 RepID=UPI003783DD36